MTIDSQAVFQPSPNFGFPNQEDHGREGQVPRWIILHGSAGGGSIEWLTNPASGVSAHYVIKGDGSVYQLVDEDDTAYANGGISTGHDAWWHPAINPNLPTISIEHEKFDVTNQVSLTAAQQAASFALIQRICQRWHIPARAADASGGITGHFSIDPVNRSQCPGTYPWTELWNYLQSGGQSVNNITYGPGSPDFDHWFTATDSDHWTCKQTGAVIQYGNLGLYRVLTISGYLPVIGLPLEAEQPHNESDGYYWSTQRFERATMVYDPKHRFDSQPGMGVSYLSHTDRVPQPAPQPQIVVGITPEFKAAVNAAGDSVAALQKMTNALPVTNA